MTNELRDVIRGQGDARYPLAKAMLTREIDGVVLTLEISPCSWMYPNYGLQVQVTMENNGGNVYLLDKAVKFENATEADLNRLFDRVKLVKCKICGKPAFDPTAAETNRDGKCETCFVGQLRKQFEKDQKKEDQRMAKLDAKYLKKGYTHRVDAWIHPAAGEDSMVTFYTQGEPSKDLIAAQLRKARSTVLDDYTVRPLSPN